MIYRLSLSILIAGFLTSTLGCANSSRGTAPGMILFVPGVAGDGSWYRNLVPALRDVGDERSVESFRWGAPAPAFFLNFNSVSIHESAERKLADRILTLLVKHPREPLDIIAHSAGGGVTLGALARLPAGRRIGKVILLHPSVSPTYPLGPALKACDTIELFHSENDKTFLEWRTSTFGTYDNIKTRAAGNVGFDLSHLSAADRLRVSMHAFCPEDRSLGNDGTHFGAMSGPFLRQRVVPLLIADFGKRISVSAPGQ